MTKDEARKELLAAIRYVAGGLIHPQEAMEIADAYAQAAVDAALADTLGMLEAHVGSHFKDEVSYRRFDEEGGNLIVGLMRGEQGELIWWGGHFDRNGRTTVAISTRAEAEALLKGDAE